MYSYNNFCWSSSSWVANCVHRKLAMTSLLFVMVTVLWLAIDKNVFSMRIEFLSRRTFASCATPYSWMKMFSPETKKKRRSLIIMYNHCVSFVCSDFTFYINSINNDEITITKNYIYLYHNAASNLSRVHQKLLAKNLLLLACSHWWGVYHSREILCMAWDLYKLCIGTLS